MEEDALPHLHDQGAPQGPYHERGPPLNESAQRRRARRAAFQLKIKAVELRRKAAGTWVEKPPHKASPAELREVAKAAASKAAADQAAKKTARELAAAAVMEALGALDVAV